MDKQKIYIIDYEAGNLYSLQRALLILGYKSEIITDPELVLRADKLILPGVGSFHQGINNLKKNNLDNAIFDYYKSGNYLLGICLGMQLFMNSSSEFGDNEGLSLIKGSVNKLQPYKKYPIPHVGWNNVEIQKNNSNFLKDISLKDNFYFIHSYYAKLNEKIEHSFITSYGSNKFTSIIINDNVLGTQFHPEKSGKVGLKMLLNFINL